MKNKMEKHSLGDSREIKSNRIIERERENL